MGRSYLAISWCFKAPKILEFWNFVRKISHFFKKIKCSKQPKKQNKLNFYFSLSGVPNVPGGWVGSDVWDKVPNKYIFFDTFPKAILSNPSNGRILNLWNPVLLISFCRKIKTFALGLNTGSRPKWTFADNVQQMLYDKTKTQRWSNDAKNTKTTIDTTVKAAAGFSRPIIRLNGAWSSVGLYLMHHLVCHNCPTTLQHLCA